MNMWPTQFNRNLSNCEVARKNVFRSFNGIRIRGLCVRTAVLYQLNYEDPYTGGRPIYWVHQPVKGMKHRMNWIMWTAGIQMKWICDHRRWICAAGRAVFKYVEHLNFEWKSLVLFFCFSLFRKNILFLSSKLHSRGCKWLLTCPNCSDSKERRQLGKATEKTWGYWGEGNLACCPSIFPPICPILRALWGHPLSVHFPAFFRSLFFAPVPHSSPLTREPALRPFFPPFFFRSLFSAPLPYSLRLSPLS